MASGRRDAVREPSRGAANGSWRARSIGPQSARIELTATAPTGQAAVELLADKVAAYERDRDVQLTPTITLDAYLRWWLDVDWVEQVEDGLITATTRISNGGVPVSRRLGTESRSAEI